MHSESILEKHKWIRPLRTIVNFALTAIFFELMWPLLHEGSFSYLPETSIGLLYILFIPMLLRPWRKAPTPVLLLHDILLLLSTAAVCLVSVEYIVKGCRISMEKSFWQGWFCYVAIGAIIYLIAGRIRLSVCMTVAVSLLHGLIDHYIMMFRGTPVMLSDIFSIGTAANVAQGYEIPFELPVLWGAGAAILYCICVILMGRRWKYKRLLTLPGVAVLGIVACAGIQSVGTGVAFWQGNRTYSEMYYFLSCASDSMVKKPSGYDANKLQELEQEYVGKAGEVKPNLIVVMNESFSDLRMVGSFETNEDYMPYLRELMEGKENTISGKLLVSTFGGGTANTEFEFLTGASLGFLPVSSSPYQMYIKKDVPSLVSALEKQGYQTVAMHPYSSSSWNRENVYKNFGFDQQIYEDQFAANAERVRDFISDRASYRKIIELYENKQPGEPLFVFDVTMQNHGGYAPKEYANYEERIQLTGQYEGKYPDVNTYLSLIKYSDEAIQEMIEYFSNIDEPTAIVFFGDHLPAVDNQFLASLIGGSVDWDSYEVKLRKFATPFFIWANYDIREQRDVQISVNYLSAYTLEALGCSTSGFDEMRLAMRQFFPQMSRIAYESVGSEWHDAASAKDEAQLKDYHMAQYAQIFDEKRRIDAWYEPKVD